MSRTITFDKEIQNHFKVNNSEIINFINQKFKKSNTSSYYNFLDNFLFSYGVISLNSGVVFDAKSKYIPYVNCSKNNIFGEKSGCTDLSKEMQSFTNSEKILAKYVISKLNYLTVKDFENWNSDLNYE